MVVDLVNPLPITRRMWPGLADEAGARLVVFECRVADVGEHRRRVEARIADVAGQIVPTWDEVVGRDYSPWDEQRDGQRLLVDMTDAEEPEPVFSCWASPRDIALSWMSEVVAMPDVLIRGLTDQAVGRIDAQARALGLSRNEFLRRKLEASEGTIAPERGLTDADWARSARVFEDLTDPEVMDAAWR